MYPFGESQVHFTNFTAGLFYVKCQQTIGNCVLNTWSHSFELLAIVNPQSSKHTYSPLDGQTNKDVPRVCITDSSYWVQLCGILNVMCCLNGFFPLCFCPGSFFEVTSL